MEENSNHTLESLVLSDSSKLNERKENVMNKPFICCFSNRWWFDHSTPAAYKIYDENDCLCCTCLDCCTWCLEFQQKKSKCCKNDVVCFMCCCSITFQ